jgi:hypothetical protein
MATIPHLALLVCEVLDSELVKNHGEYSTIFERLFHASLPEGLSDYAMHPYDVRNAMEYPSMDTLDIYDGIIITGSSNVLRRLS